jgi:hypothetical protein
MGTIGEKEKRMSKKNMDGRSTSNHDNKEFRNRSMEKQKGMAFGFQKTVTAVKKTRWMDGRTGRRMDGQADGRADGQRQIDRRTDRQRYGWMDGWMNEWMGGWMGGWGDGWVDGWMDGWMDG